MDALEADPTLRAARAEARGTAVADRALASQARLSRLLDLLAKPANRAE